MNTPMYILKFSFIRDYYSYSKKKRILESCYYSLYDGSPTDVMRRSEQFLLMLADQDMYYTASIYIKDYNIGFGTGISYSPLFSLNTAKRKWILHLQGAKIIFKPEKSYFTHIISDTDITDYITEE